MTYRRRFFPTSHMELEAYEKLQRETGLLYEALQRAWDAKCEGRGSVYNGRVTYVPPPPPKAVSWMVREKVRKLRAKANDPAVTPAEAKAFHEKANELLNKALGN